MYVFIVIANPAIKDMHKIRIIPYFIDNLFQIAYCEAKRPDLRSKTVAFRF